MGKKYKINNAGVAPDGSDLINCEIEDNGDGTFTFYDSGGTPRGSGRSLPFNITLTGYEGWNWTITVNTKTNTAMSGLWGNTDLHNVSPAEENDTWTATATGPVEEDADEARAASAT